MQNKTEFPEGIYWNEKHPNSPDFVIGGINIDRVKAIKWLENKEGKYVKLQVLKPIIKEGETEKPPYLKVDNYVSQKEFDNNTKKEMTDEQVNEMIQNNDINTDDIPF